MTGPHVVETPLLAPLRSIKFTQEGREIELTLSKLDQCSQFEICLSVDGKTRFDAWFTGKEGDR